MHLGSPKGHQAGALGSQQLFFVLPEATWTVSEYTFLGELAFPLWLLLKGVDVKRWEQRTAEVGASG